MKIAEFKAANPAYMDVPDAELADALHAKFYSEIPKDDFYSQVGISSSTPTKAADVINSDVAAQPTRAQKIAEMDAATDPMNPGYTPLTDSEAKALQGKDSQASEKTPQRSWGDVAGDAAVMTAKSAVGLPQAIAGLADLAKVATPTYWAEAVMKSVQAGEISMPKTGQLSKALESVGFRPGDAQKYLDSLYSDTTKANKDYVNKGEGFFDTAARAIERPSTIGLAAGEYAAQMLGGGGLARGLTTVAPKVAPWLAGAAGEGGMGAGSAAQQLREQSKDGLNDGRSTLSAIGSGLGTAVFGVAGGKISNSKLGQRLGISDVDTLLAGGATTRSPAGFAKQVLASGISEGFFQELPQSAQEQMWQNYATGKPLMDGVENAMAMGALTGTSIGAAGGGYNALASGAISKQDKAAQEIADTVVSSEVNRAKRDEAIAGIGQAQSVDQAIESAKSALSVPVESTEAIAQRILEIEQTQQPTIDVTYKDAQGNTITDVVRGSGAQAEVVAPTVSTESATLDQALQDAPALQDVATPVYAVDFAVSNDAPTTLPALIESAESSRSESQVANAVLQNRNRATPASIAQMQSIAKAPDYGRLGFSRDFANGAPVVAGTTYTIPNKHRGRKDVAIASDGTRIPVQYAVVDANRVLASNQADGTTNEEYGNKSKNAIRAIAGNGRVAGLQAAYVNGTAQQYASDLAADMDLHGIPASAIHGMQQPVLVRVMPNSSVTANIGDLSNTQNNLQLSAVEQARNDSARIDLDAFSFAEDGSVTPETIRQFVRSMPQSEQGGLIDTNGQPSRQAADRIQAAVFAKAYGNDGLIRLFAQAQDPEARLIMSALARVAPKMARLEGAGALDIRGIVAQAAEIAVNARRDGKPLALAAKQMDMASDPDVGLILDLFAKYPRSNAPVIEALSAAADFAYQEHNKPTVDMFGAVEKAGRAETLNKLDGQNERTSAQNLEDATRSEPAQSNVGRQSADNAAAGDANAIEASGSTEAGAAEKLNDGDIRYSRNNEQSSDLLEAYTASDVVARQEAEADAQRQSKAKQAAQDAQYRKEQDRKEIAAKSVAAADTFELGGDAMDNLSGQDGFQFSKAAGVSVGFKPGTKFLQATSDAGMVGGTVKDGVLRITFSEVDETKRGQGNGLKLYQSLIDQALDDGLKVTSDSTVEAEAVRVYEALGRSGYTVTRLEAGTTEDGAVYGVGATQPAFEVSRSEDVQRSQGSQFSKAENIDKATQQAVSQWRDSLRNAGGNPQAKEPSMPTPAVLRQMGAKANRLVLPRTYLRAILAKHQDVPASVFENLPAMLADPLFIIPHKDGGIRVFVDAQTSRGEPIAAGVSIAADGRINTITAINDHAESSGQLRMAKAIASASGKIYARNKEALAKAKASAAAAPATIALHRDSISKANVITRADIVKRIESDPKQIYSRSVGTTPSFTVAKIRDAITKAYGNTLSRLEAKGLVTIAQTEDDAITAAALARAEKMGGDFSKLKRQMLASVQIVDIKYSKEGGIEGFFDRTTGKSFLVADNLTEKTAPGTFMHEVGIHMAASGKLAPLFKRASNLLKIGKGNAFIKRVQQRMDAAGETSEEEAAAYIVTEYESNRVNAPASVIEWVKDFMASVRAWLFSKGALIKADQLTVADIAAVARANARSLAADGMRTKEAASDKKDRAFSRGGDMLYGKNEVMPETKAPGPQGDAQQGAVQGNAVAIDEDTGLPLNPDGTVTVYHHTNATAAAAIRRTGMLKAQAEPDVYVTTYRETDTGYGDTAVPIRVDPTRLQIDDEFPNGRKDFRLNVGRPGGSIRVKVENEQSTPSSQGDAAPEIITGLVEDSTLVVEHKSTDSNGWKRDLSDMFGGKTGAKLTDAIKQAGYDAIITYDKYGLSETVNLGGIKSEPTAPVSGGVRFSRADQTQSDDWSIPEKPIVDLDRAIYELQDSRIDLKRTQEAIKKSGREIEEKFDARLAETLYAGRVAYRDQQFLESEVQPLLSAMAVNSVSMNELADYLHARGAEERNAQVARVNPDLPDGGAGTNTQGILMTNQAASDYLDGIPAERRKKLDFLASKVDSITKGTRELLVREGLEKPEVIQAWEAAYKNYVPMFRDEAESGNPHPTGGGFSVRGSNSKRATGSTKQVTNILAHVLMQRQAAITKAEKNRVALSLYGMALTNPNLEVWATIRPDMQTSQIAADLKAMGVDPVVAEAGMQGVPTVRTVDPVLDRVVDRPNPMYRSLPGALVVKIGGNDRVLMFNQDNPMSLRMAESLKNLDGLTRVDLASSIVGKTTRWMAAVNTQYNPAFGIVNGIRDTFGGAINLTSTALRGKSAQVLLDAYTKAGPAIAKELAKPGGRGEWAKLYRQFQEDGGKTGYREMFKDANDRARALENQLKLLEQAGKLTPRKAASAVLDLLDGFNTTIENAVRLSAYKNALDKGLSRAESARLARELTVDFNRKGRLGRELGPLFAFFNASVQGAARTVDALRGPAGAKIITGGLVLGAMQPLLLAMAGMDDDEIPEFVKTRALIIPLFNKEKQYVAIPMPLGLHVIPNTGRIISELALSGGKDAGEKAFDAIGEIAGAFNPLGGGNIFTADGALKTVLPTIGDPLVEFGFNKNFAGGQIERETRGYSDVRPGFARAKESTQRTLTGQAYLGISKAINKIAGGSDYEAGLISPSPEALRYFAQVAGGGVLREIEKTINLTNAAINDDDIKTNSVPVIGRLFGEVDEDAVNKSRYYDASKRLDKIQAAFKAAEKAGDVEAMQKAIDQYPEFELSSMQDRIAREISKLNKLAITTIGDREQLEQIDEARVQYMRDLNEAIIQIEIESGQKPIRRQLKEYFNPKEVDRAADVAQ